MRWISRPSLLPAVGLLFAAGIGWNSPPDATDATLHRALVVPAAASPSVRDRSSHPIIRAMDFLSAQVGWIVMAKRLSLDSPATLYRTTDGGRRWIRMAQATGPTRRAWQSDFLDALVFATP